MLAAHIETGMPAALVTIVEARGSTPRETGAMMMVTLEGVAGTIGGGRLEWDAIAAARAMLVSSAKTQSLKISLGPNIGQCCGGNVELLLERATEQTLANVQMVEAVERAASPDIFIYGAGHVGRALAAALSPLPFRVRLIDERASEFASVKADSGVECVLTDQWLAKAKEAPSGAAHLVMTHLHSLDALIAATILERGDFGYLGIIGSRTKHKRFEAAFRQLDIAASDIARIVCPIGSTSVRDKRPTVIAALVAAELISCFFAKTPQGDSGLSGVP